jgi:DNA polymerase III subunit epsilon
MSRAHSSLEISAEEISALLRLFPAGLVAVDLETTGLSPLVDKIIEIAAVKLNADGSIESYHQLINPLIEIPDFTVEFHGITNEVVQSSPTIKRPLKDFWHFVGRLPVVGHNSSFDLGWLIKASHDFQIQFPPLDIYDTCRFARATWKGRDAGPANFKLATLCEFYAFPLKHHQAMEDTLACLKIMARCAALEIDLSATLMKSFVFRLSDFDRNDCFNFSTRLKGLAEMVQAKELLKISYRSSSAHGRSRPLRPIGLMPLPQGPVLFAECLLTGMNKSFLLKKIKTYARLEASYWRPEKPHV